MTLLPGQEPEDSGDLVRAGAGQRPDGTFRLQKS
jgi:hypothetical protein